LVLRSRTLFVLGAGASKEIGMPTGHELKHKLATRLNIRFPDGWTQSTGDQSITDALRFLAKQANGGRGDINPYLHKAWQMVGALPQAMSIDNYIDALEDPDIALLGKLSIVREIIQCEKDSALYFNEESDRSGVLSRAEGTHYHGLFQLLSENLRKSGIDQFFTNAAFVSFNYDRSLEWYFQQAIQNYYGVTAQQAWGALSRLKVIHPYGTVGRLPWLDPKPGFVPYGGSYNHDYLELSKAIRTFTEQFSDKSISDAIEAEVTAAERIVFLGFGFHDINMQTLATSAKTKLRHVIGTALGVSKPDVDAISRSILASFATPQTNPAFHQTERIDLRSDLKCAGVFTEYARSLRA